MLKENLPKKDPCLENFRPENPPIWAAYMIQETNENKENMLEFLNSLAI